MLYQLRASANATERFEAHWRHATGVIIQGRYGELPADPGPSSSFFHLLLLLSSASSLHVCIDSLVLGLGVWIDAEGGE